MRFNLVVHHKKPMDTGLHTLHFLVAESDGSTTLEELAGRLQGKEGFRHQDRETLVNTMESVIHRHPELFCLSTEQDETASRVPSLVAGVVRTPR